MKLSLNAKIQGRHKDADIQFALECSPAEAIEIMNQQGSMINELLKAVSEFRKEEVVEHNRDLMKEVSYLRDKIANLEEENGKLYSEAIRKSSKPWGDKL